jgi:hypothetical protein
MTNDNSLDPLTMEVKHEILRLVYGTNDRTGETQKVFHGLALAFGAVLSQVQPRPADAAAWMRREANRMQSLGSNKDAEGTIQ